MRCFFLQAANRKVAGCKNSATTSTIKRPEREKAAVFSTGNFHEFLRLAAAPEGIFSLPRCVKQKQRDLSP